MCHYFLLKTEIRASGQLHSVFIPEISPISTEECRTECVFQRGKCHPQETEHACKSRIFLA